MAGTNRQRAIARALTALLPLAPYIDAENEKLLGEGYDRDAARFFVIGEINAVLTRWRATRLLDPDDEEI